MNNPDHTIQVKENGRHRGYVSGSYIERKLIHVDHFPTRSDAEWQKFSRLVLHLRRENPGLQFIPKASKPGQRMFLNSGGAA